MIDSVKKNKLKNILVSMSSSQELEALDTLEGIGLSNGMKELNAKIEALAQSSSEELRQVATILAESVLKTKKEMAQLAEALVETHTEASKELIKVLSDLKSSIGTSYSEGFNKNAGPLYKTMINAIAGVEKSIKDKPDAPVWRWPQYAAVSVRDKNFANINPSLDAFNIGDYDDVQLSYTGSNLTGVTYALNGATTAVLALTYSGSNLTRVQRTQ